MTRSIKFEDPNVAAVFRSYPQAVRAKLMRLRQLIFDVAATTDGVGELQETLKWGQPSYLTRKTKNGSLVRIDQIVSRPGTYAMYFHCQTTLVDSFREMFRDDFTFAGNRSIVFQTRDPVPLKQLRECVALALTYHRTKKSARKSLPAGAHAGGSVSRGPRPKHRF